MKDAPVFLERENVSYTQSNTVTTVVFFLKSQMNYMERGMPTYGVTVIIIGNGLGNQSSKYLDEAVCIFHSAYNLGEQYKSDYSPHSNYGQIVEQISLFNHGRATSLEGKL